MSNQKEIIIKAMKLKKSFITGDTEQTIFENLDLSDRDAFIARQILKEIRARLTFLNNVGLDYLTLSRAAATLSGGEAQRIRLATQIGSGLVGVLYILDEPSIGLHQRDNDKLLATLKDLRDMGNTLLVVDGPVSERAQEDRRAAAAAQGDRQETRHQGSR